MYKNGDNRHTKYYSIELASQLCVRYIDGFNKSAKNQIQLTQTSLIRRQNTKTALCKIGQISDSGKMRIQSRENGIQLEIKLLKLGRFRELTVLKIFITDYCQIEDLTKKGHQQVKAGSGRPKARYCMIIWSVSAPTEGETASVLDYLCACKWLSLWIFDVEEPTLTCTIPSLQIAVTIFCGHVIQK